MNINIKKQHLLIKNFNSENKRYSRISLFIWNG